MKKKSFHSKLNLKKHKISNLQQNDLQGGADAITSGTYLIITSIKIFTEHISIRICTVDSMCPEPIPPGTGTTTGG